ncbi:MAG: polysaccharide deacetylase family protein [Gammaproteobacteria bacterium]|nr:polysaccharide deacetylase family protein [Gammaproteobacteria bacterium]MBU1722679.1 polysaccharide deacetylase family protein [Gammaproteobacteria bacterium]MBU2006557.1 polysaccharide deacetylase family protein [Gammaproteobacteria bacterium]
MEAGWIRLLAGALLWVVASAAGAVDCATIQAKYHCPADGRYPLHLSFDDGPALQTMDVLDVLQRERVPATFFILAEKIDCDAILQQCRQKAPSAATDGSQCLEFQQCQTRRQILARAKQEGHMIGSHSYSHLHYSTVEPDLMALHLRDARRLTMPYFTTNPPLFRLPYGDGWFNRKKDGHVMQALQELGFLHVDWQLSAFDWDENNQHDDKILENVLTQVCSRKTGGVVLFHDGVDNQMHEGRLFTTEHIGEWIPAMRCVVDFKPLEYFVKGFRKW